ncbi:acetyl-CoA carboxylase biotin carboxyl carrier protein [Weizmannia acidilactici]|uniref:acetyl-CoA carboxylase biotin carboxyl carrier protein n=1 Tax=Weizmannia acidilactici TaxID=2607726 RepID=UPI00124DC144|nr:acetyl-CoA carboxylase biotin carboxyl carrier protein [Weizmannia acidilactici]GER72447.1 biotin carboxyl carrier protein of acetyl-CoA carboxylase [Weizmannia acidilactici]
MLKVEDIQALIELVDRSSLDEFEYENEGTVIKMKKNSGVQVVERPLREAAAPVPAPQPPVHSEAAQPATPVQSQTPATSNDENLHKIVSPMVGTFYQASSPEAEPYVQVGSKVSPNTVVCIIEAMKLFNEIEAEVEGEIVDILVKDGQLVEFGQPLFLVKTK